MERSKDEVLKFIFWYVKTKDFISILYNQFTSQIQMVQSFFLNSTSKNSRIWRLQVAYMHIVFHEKQHKKIRSISIYNRLRETLYVLFVRDEQAVIFRFVFSRNFW